jgi:hypothetical protein
MKQNGITRVDIYKYCCSLGMQQIKDHNGDLDNYFASGEIVRTRRWCVIINWAFSVNASMYNLDEVYNVYDPVAQRMTFIYCGNGQVQENNDLACSEKSFTRKFSINPDLTPGSSLSIGHEKQSYTTPYVMAFACEWCDLPGINNYQLSLNDKW